MSKSRYLFNCQAVVCLIVTLTLLWEVSCESTLEQCQDIDLSHRKLNKDLYNLTRKSLTEISANRTSLGVSWTINDTTDVCGFTVFVWKNSEENARLILANVSKEIATHTAKIEDLSPGTLYEIYVETVYATVHETVSWKLQLKSIGYGPDNNVLNCSKLGTAIWNQETGGCECKQHITFGTLCDSCLSGTYIHPQQGCVQCDRCPVTLGGNGTCIYDADELMLCNCMEGYTGKHCDRCIPGEYFREPITDTSLPCIKCNYNTTVKPILNENCYQNIPPQVENTRHSRAMIGIFATIMIICAVVVSYIYIRHWRKNRRLRGFVAAHTKDHNDRMKFSSMMEEPEVDFYLPQKK